MLQLAHIQAEIFTEHTTAFLLQPKSSLVILKMKKKLFPVFN